MKKQWSKVKKHEKIIFEDVTLGGDCILVLFLSLHLAGIGPSNRANYIFVKKLAI